MTTTELKTIAEDAEKWRQDQRSLKELLGWDAEQWATALEWYQPHSAIAPTAIEEVRRIQAAYIKRFEHPPAKTASTVFRYIEGQIRYLWPV